MTDIPLAMPAAAAAGGDGPPAGQIQMAFAGPAPQRRWTVLIRLVLVLPQAILLGVAGIAAFVVAVIGWFAALALGRLPGWAAEFLSGWLRWWARVTAYAWLLTDKYPPFSVHDADYPVRLAAAPGRLSRPAVFFRFILSVPVWLVAGLVSEGTSTIVAVVIWLIVLIGGRMPVALHQALTAIVRFQARFYGYLLLLTGTYPWWGLFGDRPAPPAPAPPGAPWEPAAPAPVPAPAGPASWQLVLSSRARKLVVLFLVLGVLTAVANGVLNAVNISAGLQRVNAVNTVSQAHDALGRTLVTLQRRTRACGSSLPCLTRADAQGGRAFAAFAAAVRSTPMPGGAAGAARSLERVSLRLAGYFRELASAPSPSAYQEMLFSGGLQQALGQFDTRYRQLGIALGAVR